MKATYRPIAALIALSFAGLTSCASMNQECTTCCATKAKPGAACCDTKKAPGATKTGSGHHAAEPKKS